MAALVGALVILPNILAPCLRSYHLSHDPSAVDVWSNNGRPTNIAPFDHFTGALPYLAKIKEVSEHGLPYDPFIFENMKNFGNTLSDALPFTVLGFLNKCLNNLDLTVIVYTFLLMFISTILIYKIMMQATSDELFSLFSSFWVNLFIIWYYFDYDLFFQSPLKMALRTLNYLFPVFPNISDSVGPDKTLYVFTRAMFFLAIYLFLKVISKQKCGNRLALASGFLGGLLAITHWIELGHYLAAVPLYSFGQWIRTRKIQRSVILSYAITLLLAIPVILMRGSFFFHSDSDPDIIRIARIAEHEPGRYFFLPSFLFLAVYLIVVFRNRKIDDPTVLWIAAIIGSAFPFSNIQLITGYEFSLSHWQIFGNVFLVMLLLIVVYRWLLKRISMQSCYAAFRYSIVILAVLMLSRGIMLAKDRYTFSALPRDYEEAFDFLNDHTEEDSVVVTLSSEMIIDIPLFTHNKTLIAHASAILSDISIQENTRRLMYALSLYGINREYFLEKHFMNLDLYNEVHKRFFVAEKFRRDLLTRSLWEKAHVYDTTPNVLIGADAMRQLLETTQVPSPGTFRADYVMFTHLEREYVTEESVFKKGWEKLFKNKSVSLYKINR